MDTTNWVENSSKWLSSVSVICFSCSPHQKKIGVTKTTTWLPVEDLDLRTSILATKPPLTLSRDPHPSGGSFCLTQTVATLRGAEGHFFCWKHGWIVKMVQKKRECKNHHITKHSQKEQFNNMDFVLKMMNNSNKTSRKTFYYVITLVVTILQLFQGFQLL